MLISGIQGLSDPSNAVSKTYTTVINSLQDARNVK